MHTDEMPTTVFVGRVFVPTGVLPLRGKQRFEP
jgi:hypothetical protein